MKLGITFLMKNTEETVEKYIELPAFEELEDLAHHCEKCGIGFISLTDIITNFCILQGYSFGGIEMIELVI